ncbi:HD-domain/PDEase-like protein [Xylaria nigripes]|nr:HD-domain/PDEase-like protein [Xylaria nigripes]
MERDACNIIYVDRNVYQDRLLRSPAAYLHETGELRANLEMLLNAFDHVHLCTTGAQCLEKLVHLHDAALIEVKPTLVLIDTPHDGRLQEPTPTSSHPSSRPISPTNVNDNEEEEEEDDDDVFTDLYGIRLLEKIVCETHLRNLSKLVVPIPIVSFHLLRTPPAIDGTDERPFQPAYAEYFAESRGPVNSVVTKRSILRRCLDSGAVDVMESPLDVKTLTTLEFHVCRANREAARDQQALIELRRGRKRSWVGMHQEQPFAYLREAMVSDLMSGICRLGEEREDRLSTVRIDVSSKRRAEVEQAPGTWHFCAPYYDDDSLLIAAASIFKHTLAMPELEKWRLSTDQITTFLVACRAAYNPFVPYHNFRHAVDVLQATFDFLVQIGTLPPYPHMQQSFSSTQKSPVASLLGPIEALMLLVSAIGHDVGHPGVNNGFLVTLKAPLAQLYNDRSVLESFHCAAFSQILRRYWPRVFEDTKMRTLMINSILATDMGVHFDYMKRLSRLQEKLKLEPIIDKWPEPVREEQKALLCSLLIKCADISNVARKYDTALQWMNILCEEFSRQAAMEQEIEIPSSLISPPKKDFTSLAKAQLGFMKLFAAPLFQGVAEVLPQMQYTVTAIEKNRRHFEKALERIPGMVEEDRKFFTRYPLDANIMKLARSLAADEGDYPTRTEKDKLAPVPVNQPGIKDVPFGPRDRRSQTPRTARHVKEPNGNAIPVDKPVDFAPSDSFQKEDIFASRCGRQRSSDTTEGSNSALGSGDWRPQTTGAITGRMPLSPSTQGTSIVSQDSMERPSSNPTTAVTAPDLSSTPTPMGALMDSAPVSEEESSTTLKPDGTLRKKTSRFRMNVSTFFRRNKGASSPVPPNGSNG